jgi:LPS-assembly lipoprotein
MLKPLRIIFLLAAAIELASCGSYRPLYGKGPDGMSVASSLSSLSVQEQHTRASQMLRNEILDGTGTGQQRYNLKLDATEKTVDVANLSSTTNLRRRFMLSAHYDLVDTLSDKTLTSGESFSNVEFDTINVPVSDLAAADNAKMRAAKELGQDIKLRLAAFLSSQKQ